MFADFHGLACIVRMHLRKSTAIMVSAHRLRIIELPARHFASLARACVLINVVGARARLQTSALGESKPSTSWGGRAPGFAARKPSRRAKLFCDEARQKPPFIYLRARFFTGPVRKQRAFK